jgi:cytidylate kinase
MPLDISKLLQRQALRQDLQVRVGSLPRHEPCIALSRLPGSAAATLGLDLSKRLGFDFFGIELVDRMAREEGLPKQLAAAFDEHVRSGIDRYLVDAFREGSLLESDYLRHLVHAIRSIGEAGGAVFLGRGAPYILPPDRTLRVLVVAPRASRVERLAKARGLAREEAERELRREEHERKRFLTHYFRVDPDDPERYDLCVNTETLARAGACETVLMAYQRRFGAARPEAWAPL